MDDGSAFDPREAPLPNLDAPLEERQAGGLGMHLVRETMDEIDYRREDGRNVLTVRTSVRSASLDGIEGRLSVSRCAARSGGPRSSSR